MMLLTILRSLVMIQLVMVVVVSSQKKRERSDIVGSCCGCACWRGNSSNTDSSSSGSVKRWPDLQHLKQVTRFQADDRVCSRRTGSSDNIGLILQISNIAFFLRVLLLSLSVHIQCRIDPIFLLHVELFTDYVVSVRKILEIERGVSIINWIFWSGHLSVIFGSKGTYKSPYRFFVFIFTKHTANVNT
jgi:hypothetical protein